MARIIQTQEQTDALKSVKIALKALNSINDFITKIEIGETDSVMFSANLSGSSVKLPFDKKTALELLNKQKLKLKKDISASASRFYIQLDDADKKILGDNS